MKRKRGRPKGTTRAAGYKVSPGRPRKQPESSWDIRVKAITKAWHIMFNDNGETK